MNVLAVLHRRDLAPGVHFVAEGSLVVWVGADGEVRATRNRCGHQGGRFGAPAGCVLTCPHHGWQLDASRMVYINPTNGQVQRELRVQELGEGRLAVIEENTDQPWSDWQSRAPLAPGELTIRFLAHASAEITAGGHTLITDPWLTGPAFLRGWWLVHTPPADWMDRLVDADVIYISHNHSDHLNPSTLSQLAEQTTEVRFVVPPFEDCVEKLRLHGFRRVDVVPFGSWVPFGDEGRFMLLRDGTTRNDSGLLLEYKGHRILNAVDCSDLNGGVFPDGVDVLLMAFAGGASGFPVCWADLYSEDEINRRVRADRNRILRRVVETAQATQARFLVPFAGYFTEAHPADADVKRRNWKNSPEAVVEAVENQTTARGWVPVPGSALDLATGEVDSSGAVHETPTYDFDRWIAPISAANDFGPLKSPQGILHYFEWAGYRGDLVLDVLETNDTFDTVLRRTTIDLRGPRLAGGQVDSGLRYLRMRVRKDVFRYVLQNGLPWEEISIGFNARFTRVPDVYNLDFWAHMQDALPAGSAWS